MKPNPCCNDPKNLTRAWFQDNPWRKLKRLFQPEQLPHRLVDHCKVCRCNHYIMIVPEIPVLGTLNDIGT